MKHFFSRFMGAGDAPKYETANDNLRTFAAVGYPKAGNTWLRITLGRYLQTVYGLIEMPLMDSAEFPNLASAGCKTIGEFTHFPLEWTSQCESDLTYASVVSPFRGQRVVLLLRHPLDVLVSQYMQERFRNKTTPFAGSLQEFIEHPVFGIGKLIKFYRLWADAFNDVPDLHIWRYEDARRKPVDSFVELLTFLGEVVRAHAIDEAVDYASFENLSAIERSGKRDIVYKSSGLYVFGSEVGGDSNAMHVRKGKVGGYKEELSPEMAAQLEARVRSEMPEFFGYR